MKRLQGPIIRVIQDITNELAIGQVMDFDLFETYYAIRDYMKDHGQLWRQARANDYRISGGCLYINDELITRVAPLPRRPYSEAAGYWEGRILARQEASYEF